MAKMLDLVTLGDQKIYLLDSDPSKDDGFSEARVNDIAMISGTVGFYLKVGSDPTEWHPLVGEVRTPEIIQLTQTDIDNKYIKLKRKPYNDIRVVYEEGFQQILGMDFRLNGDTVEWDGMNLDGFLEEGEILAIYY